MRGPILSIAAIVALAGWAGAAAAASAPPAPDLDALVSYRSEQVLANGTTRVDTWQERLVRRGDRVATERVLPAALRSAHAPHEHGDAAELAGHKHFDIDRTTRVLQFDGSSRVALSYVDRTERRVVAVPKEEWAAVGFDGRYDAAAHLVPPSLIASLPVQSRPAAGLAWHVQKSEGWTHRVLWSEPLQVAMRIESRREDGTMSRSVQVERASPAALPWSGTADYRQMVYDDFMD